MARRWLVLLALVSATGCVGEVAEIVECTMACEHYDDCVDDAYDTTGCADACEDASDGSDAYEASVRACDECLDDNACSADCNDECDGIIPAF